MVLPIASNMTFASATDGSATADPAIHQYLWMRLPAEAADIIQGAPWVDVMKGTTVSSHTAWTIFKYSDCVALATEVWSLAQSAMEESILRRPPCPQATAAALALTVVGANALTCQHRGSLATHMRKVASDIRARAVLPGATAEELADAEALRLAAPQLLTKATGPVYRWMTELTYGAAFIHCRFGLVRLIYFYDAHLVCCTAGAPAPGVLQMLREACTLEGTIAANTAVPPAAPTAADFTAGTAEEQAAELAAATAALAIAPPPDNQDSGSTAYAVCAMAARIPYEARLSLRSDARHGAARRMAARFEVQGALEKPTGDSPGMQSRLEAVLAQEAPQTTILIGQVAVAHLTTAELSQALADAAAAVHLPAAARDTKVLGTPQGVHTLERALVVHAPWMAHALYDEAGNDLPFAAKLDALRDHIDEMQTYQASGGAAPQSAADQAAGAPRHASQTAAWQREVSQGASASVAYDLMLILSDPQHTASHALECGLRGCTESHPDRRSTPFTHAYILGRIPAAVCNQKLWRYSQYCSDEHLGEYLARMVMSSMVRAKHMTPKIEERLKGFAMTGLAKAVKGDWAGIDLYKHVFHSIETELAVRANAAPPANSTPSHLVYTDISHNAKLPSVLRGIMEALGQQTRGDLSLSETIAEHNSLISGLIGYGARAMAQLLRSTRTLYVAYFKEFGSAYQATTSGANVLAEFPATNLRPDSAARLLEVFTMQKEGLDEAQKQHDMAQYMRTVSDTRTQATGLSNMAAAQELLRAGADSDPVGGTNEDNPKLTRGERRAEKRKREAEAAGKDAKDKKPPGTKPPAERAADQNKAREDKHALYVAAGQGTLQGPADAQTWTLGPAKFNMTEARKAYPGKCVLAILANSLGYDAKSRLQLVAQVCRSGAEAHPHGCPEHTINLDTDKKPQEFRVNSDGTPLTRTPKGRGSGAGRQGAPRGGTARGRGAARGGRARGRGKGGGK